MIYLQEDSVVRRAIIACFPSTIYLRAGHPLPARIIR